MNGHFEVRDMACHRQDELFEKTGADPISSSTKKIFATRSFLPIGTEETQHLCVPAGHVREHLRNVARTTSCVLAKCGELTRLQ